MSFLRYTQTHKKREEADKSGNTRFYRLKISSKGLSKTSQVGISI